MEKLELNDFKAIFIVILELQKEFYCIQSVSWIVFCCRWSRRLGLQTVV